MKFIFALMMMFVANAVIAQTPATYFSLYDRKVYSLKNKGVRDFVVDVSSSKLTEQVNAHKIFGEVKNLVFRIYWTLAPERLAVEILGLPEGFHAAKHELRLNFMPLLDNLLPMTVEQRFPGYKISAGKNPREYIAADSTGVAPIPSYVIKFDTEDKLSEIIGMKPVGSWNMEWIYEKKGFSDGRWVTTQINVTNSEGGQTLTTSRRLNYGTAQGMGVLSEVVLTVDQSGPKTFRTQENIEFNNYKINTGEGMKYFLSDAPVPAKQSP